MRDQIYYRLVEKNNRLEFHVSIDKADVEAEQALGKAIALGSPKLEEFRAACLAEAKIYKMDEV